MMPARMPGEPRRHAAVTFDVEEVVETLLTELRLGEIVSAEDYIDDYIDHHKAAHGARPLRSVIANPTASADFQAWARERITREANETCGWLQQLVRDGVVRAWRALVADEGWEPNVGRHVGVHWTFTQSKAIPYDEGDGTHLYVVEADIPEASIDWTQTVIHHLTRDADEDEITILPDAPVTVLDVNAKPLRRPTFSLR